MYTLLVDEEKKISDLFISSRKICFLAGAGISIDPPSNLPSGLNFSKNLLKQIIPRQEFQKVANLMNKDKLDEIDNFLRFEQILGYLDDYDSEKTLQVLECFSNINTPNFNHFFLANMIKKKKTPVLTTNFDNLIEYALLESGVECGTIKLIIEEEDWQNVKDGFFNLYKIHGSLIDICRNKICYNTIQATLHQIIKNKGGKFELELWKYTIILKILKEYDLIVIGYSGLDDFDVMPSLWNIKSDRKIFWINHEKKLQVDNARIESIRETNGKILSKNDSDIYLLNFLKQKSRTPSNIYRINVNTKNFIKWFAKKYELQIAPRNQIRNNIKKFLLPNLDFKEKDKWFLTGKIFYDRNLFEESLNCYLESLNIAENDGDVNLQLKCLNELSSFNRKSTTTNSIYFAKKQLEIAKNKKIKIEEAKALNNISTINFEQNNENFSQVISQYEEALKIVDKLDNQEALKEKAMILNNIAAVYHKKGDDKKAEGFLEESKKITEELGDIWELTDCYNNIGTLFEEWGDISNNTQTSYYEVALKYYQKAESSSDKIGYKRGYARAIRNIASIYKQQGNLEHALSNYNQAHKIFTIYGYYYEQAECLVKQGTLFFKLRNIKLAIDFYQKAANIYKFTLDNNFIEDKLWNLAFLGTSLIEDSNLEEANVILTNAKEQYSTHNIYIPKLFTEILINLAIVNERLDQYEDAYTLFRKAFDLKSYEISTKQFLEFKLREIRKKITNSS
ncbi:MAG: tetratricopeptide repeat protein [Candidatus Hodarchaeales archaeon]|jgi:tetratricopeptide (TPR) repeat protein